MKALSYVHGSAGPPLLSATIGAFLDDVVAQKGDREALVSVRQGVRLTYAELKAEADAFATGLLALGLEPGDRLGIWSPNRFEWVVVQFAAAKAGLILVNINPAYRVSELEHVLRAAGCKALVTASQFKSSNYPAMTAELVPQLPLTREPVTSERLPELRRLIVFDDAQGCDCLRYSDVIGLGRASGLARLSALELGFDDPVNIQFTSGTTGLPKGVTLSHHNLLNNGLQVGVTTGIKPDDRVCLPVPLYHCFGMVMGVLVCLTQGATMVFPSEGFEALAALQAIAGERCTHLYGVPTMFIAILGEDTFADFDLSSLRGGIMAGAPCPVEVMKAVMRDMNMAEVTIAYGMTETSPVSFQTRISDPVDVRVSTVGRIMPHLEVKIIDEKGRVTPLGQSGELCTRGYSVMLGYWGEEAKTRDVLDAAGWMRTGDLATLDEQGYCRIIGRSKDLVIRGGENISPREIEEFLYRHPSIRDIQIVGLPDDRFGEELCAWIVLQPEARIGTDDIRAFCRGQIAHFKIPRYIKFVDAFPTTATGKVQKFMIQAAMIEELGLRKVPS
jgi:fatty-acyl-CoA synthase